MDKVSKKSELTEEQKLLLNEVETLLKTLEQHPYGLYVPGTRFLKRCPISTESYCFDAGRLIKDALLLNTLLGEKDGLLRQNLGSTINHEIALVNASSKASKQKIMEAMNKATEHLKRDLYFLLRFEG